MDTILGFSFLPPLVLPGESPVLWGSLAPHSSCIGHSPASAISWSHRLDAGGICKSADILRAELTVRFPPCPQLGMGQLRVVRDHYVFIRYKEMNSSRLLVFMIQRPVFGVKVVFLLGE